MKQSPKMPPAQTDGQETQFPDPFQLGRILAEVSQKTQPLLQEFFRKYDFKMQEADLDPLNMRTAWADFMTNLLSDPQKLVAMQAKFWNDWMTLCREGTARFMGENRPDIYSPETGDKRFRSPAWTENPYFDFVKQSYLMTSHWAREVVGQAEGLDDDTRTRLDFQARQFINALSPSNFLFTNPEVLQETLRTNGDNLVRGLQNLLEDMERGQGRLKISTTNYEAFRLGENIATTPGKVVYQNDLMQLIQYDATTEKVFKTPLLIVPPWINKYYILDLKPENSLVRWLTEQGHTVFMISWVNPDRRLARKRFENYMSEGVLEALTQVEKITGEDECNLTGYCLGGTLLAVTLAWLAVQKEEGRISSATFLTSLVDFEEAGELRIFMDESQLKLLDKEMGEKGFLPADHLRKTFSLLRSNDLIWSFVINNYLMGREPFPFDLLYWNDDSTNMPAAMHSFYMRKCYHENLLREPGGVVMNGVPIDMKRVKTDCYFLSAKEDHIAPWKATYATTQLFRGPQTFTLSASGHVAGVINPPAAGKYCFWTSDDTPADPDQWLSAAERREGSWWPHWAGWLEDHSGQKVPARKAGGGKLRPVEDAPGSYVRMKAE